MIRIGYLCVGFSWALVIAELHEGRFLPLGIGAAFVCLGGVVMQEIGLQLGKSDAV